MARVAETERHALLGRLVIDNDGEEVGRITRVYLDQRAATDPEWVAVRTGVVMGKDALIPLSALQEVADGAFLAPFDRDAVNAAPHSDLETDLTAEHERELFEFYGLPYEAGAGGLAARADATPSEEAPAQQIGNDDFLHRAMTHVVGGPGRLRAWQDQEV
jgi:sporulation protein YlmC with PRC-barrel domain